MTDQFTDEQLTEAQGEQAAKELIQSKNRQQRFQDELLDFDTVLENIRRSLLSVQVQTFQMENDDGEPILVEFVRKDNGIWKRHDQMDADEREQVYSESLCNQKCVNDVVALLKGLVNPNVAASKFDRKDVQSVGEAAEHALVNQLKGNFDKYGIEDTDDADAIIAVVRGNLKGTTGKAKGANFLKRLLESREFKFIGKSSEEEDEDGWGSLT